MNCGSDLLDMQKLSRYNKGYRYILAIIDVMSRYLRDFPIKDKKASTTKQVLQKVFKKKVYFAYFGIKLGDQDKSWAPHVVCSVCVEELRQWFQVQGFNLKNRMDISYPTIIRSAIRPVPHGPDLPIPSPPDTLDNILDDLDQILHIRSDSDDGYDPGTNDPELSLNQI
ncbi:uncharacterized protein TNCV_3984971 [Trichonephila clavipes]|nr:uncharacterized protein TNCV_3984971 [Trichonephila clavipes]